jgi:hypothetical protein
MPQFRADYDVKGSLVLPTGSAPVLVRSESPAFEMTFRNADPDESGYVPNLVVQVVAESNSIDHVARQFRSLLAKQLDLLSFVTHATFAIGQCRRVLEWEPFKKNRALRPQQEFDLHYPPSPDLQETLFDSVQALLNAEPPDYILNALRFFRLGVRERQLEDQFQHFWLAIETTAEGSKEIAKSPIPCPRCAAELFCAKCSTTPVRRPMARQAIKKLLSKLHGNSDQLYRMLVRTRDHLLHGRSPDLVEAKIGASMEALVDMAGVTAWNAIWHSMPRPDQQISLMAYRDGKFANGTLVADLAMEFAYPGDAAHPTEDQIPKPKISMSVKFVSGSPDGSQQKTED